MLRLLKVSRRKACFPTNNRQLLNPKTMLEPKEIPQRRLPRYGFHTHTELFNGRAAMLGFIALLVVEMKLGHGLLIW